MPKPKRKVAVCGTTSMYHKGCRCAECTSAVREYNRKDYHANPSRTRRYHLRTKYGITPEIFDDMLFAQEGMCGICGRVFNRTPAIDHSHVTGVIRGLLCGKCNGTLGWYEICAKGIHRYLLEAKFGKSTKRVVPVRKGRSAR